MSEHHLKMRAPELAWRGNVPLATAFDDPYFSLEDGLAETRHVFLAANDLPARFRDGFHIAELGFGTGLNLIASLALWRESGIVGRLIYTSFELFPMPVTDMRRALAAFPEVAAVADEVLGAFDPATGGAALADLTFALVPGDARQTVPIWSGKADAWFLDGFSPARNPELWELGLLSEVARHTMPEGTAATYSAAGSVRAALADAGFRGRARGRLRAQTAHDASRAQMKQTSNRAGILLMIATTFIFAAQDGISNHLAAEYNTFMVVMVRYWFFAAFACFLVTRTAEGFLRTVRTPQPVLQIGRGLMLAAEICVAIYGFTLLGLVESHAVFACYPLMITALSGPLLRERVGWRRWIAVLAGFVGMLIILEPGRGVFDPVALIPFLSAFMFALYSLMTRYAAGKDSALTSFFWTGVTGAVVMSGFGLANWEWMSGPDWGWMGLLCLTGVLGHWLLIKCYDLAEASAVQPFAFFHQIFAVMVGIVIFNEALRTNVAFGAAIILAAGVFALWRAHRKELGSD